MFTITATSDISGGMVEFLFFIASNVLARSWLVDFPSPGARRSYRDRDTFRPSNTLTTDGAFP